MESLPLQASGMDRRYGCSMQQGTSSITEMISGILALGAVEQERMPTARIHSTICEMKACEPVLSDVGFSLTGDVCYSGTVDKAIRDLVDWGAFEVEGDAVVVTKGIRLYRSGLSRSLTGVRFQAVQAVSARFFDRLRKHGESPD